MATNAPAQTEEPPQERRVYHGKIDNDDDYSEMTIEGHVGYSRVVSVKIEIWSTSFEFSLCPGNAKELARHLNEAADSAMAAKYP